MLQYNLKKYKDHFARLKDGRKNIVKQENAGTKPKPKPKRGGRSTSTKPLETSGQQCPVRAPLFQPFMLVLYVAFVPGIQAHTARAKMITILPEVITY